MSVSVVVPRSPGSCTHRDTNWDWLRSRWAALHPTWQIVEGTAPAAGWCKAAAVADALTEATSHVLVICDSDLLCDTAAITRAVQAVQIGTPWAVPFHTVRRLTPSATADVVAQDPTGHLDLPHDRASLARAPAAGRPGGGVFVVTRTAYELVGGFDPRFVGWGGEDVSLGFALTTLAGPPTRTRGDLFHLWHPPQRDRRPGRNGHHMPLQRRYQNALDDPAAMRALVAEHHEVPT